MSGSVASSKLKPMFAYRLHSGAVARTLSRTVRPQAPLPSRKRTFRLVLAHLFVAEARVLPSPMMIGPPVGAFAHVVNPGCWSMTRPSAFLEKPRERDRES